MNESQWDEKLRSFLKRTGEDLKRAGNDIRVEAERLMKEVQDPERQEKVKQGLSTFTTWARKTAEEVAAVVETGVKKAEGAVRGAAEKAQGSVDSPPAEAPPPHASTPTEAPPHDTPVDTPVVAAPKKTIGGKKKKAGAGRSGAAAPKKPLGKKRGP